MRTCLPPHPAPYPGLFTPPQSVDAQWLPGATQVWQTPDGVSRLNHDHLHRVLSAKLPFPDRRKRPSQA